MRPLKTHEQKILVFPTITVEPVRKPEQEEETLPRTNIHRSYRGSYQEPFRSPEKKKTKHLYVWGSISFFALILCVSGLMVHMLAIQNQPQPLIVQSNGVTYLPYKVGLDGSAPIVTVTSIAGVTPVPTVMSTGKPVGWSILGSPTVSVDLINHVLSYYGSPAQGEGQDFYDLGKEYGIDPVFALAFFHHESDFGTTGVARFTKSIGNSRCIDSNCYYSTYGGYEKYDSWKQGIAEWYWQMTQYANGRLWQYLHGDGTYRKLTTVDQIIPVYAPAADHNDENAYIAAIKYAVNVWRSGKIAL